MTPEMFACWIMLRSILNYSSGGSNTPLLKVLILKVLLKKQKYCQPNILKVSTLKVIFLKTKKL